MVHRGRGASYKIKFERSLLPAIASSFSRT
jgi:hypothetical protein